MVETTWASGATELLRHADSHIDLEESAFDKRIAFISIDNCVETSVRKFLSLPEGKSGVKVPRKDVMAAENSYPGLVDLLFEHTGIRLTGIAPYGACARGVIATAPRGTAPAMYPERCSLSLSPRTPDGSLTVARGCTAERSGDPRGLTFGSNNPGTMGNPASAVYPTE